MKAWPKVALSELLQSVTDPVSVQQDASYPNFGIYSFGRGLFKKREIAGMQTSARTLYRVRAGDFIYSRLFAFEGAYGVVDEQFDGHFTSNEYPSFEVDRTRLDPRFLKTYFQLPRVWHEIAVGSKGVGSRRIRVQPDRVLTHGMPLPPIEEQRAIVARLDALAEKTRQLETHLEVVEKDSLRLLVTVATRRDISDEQRRALGWVPGAISDIATISQQSEIVDVGKSYPNVGILSYAKGVFRKAPIEGSATSAKILYKIKPGQFIYSRLFAFEGAYALVPDEFDGCYVSNEFPTFETTDDSISARFLMALFMTKDDWLEMRASTKGVGDRRLRIQPEHILARKIWIPPAREFPRINVLFEQHQALKSRHAAIREANAALLPATLERVFASGH